MKQKQLDYIKTNFSRYHDAIGAVKIQKPDPTCHISHALVRGENLSLLNKVEISDLAREKIASCSYSRERTFKFEEIFALPASYHKALKDYQAALKLAESRINQFKNEARPIITKAELTDADPEEIMGELRALALKYGVEL